MQFHLYEDCDLKAYEAIKPNDFMNAAIPLELKQNYWQNNCSDIKLDINNTFKA